MTTVIVSDLHLGTRSHPWVLSTAEARETLARAVADADRLVLLGDAVELRESPVADALEAARPTLAALGEAMAGRQITLVPGNHDHQLAAPLLDELRMNGSLAELGLDSTIPAPSTGLTGRVAEALGRAEVTLAYPGTWIRDDVYATHGHYMDCHNTIPTIECLSIAATARAIGGLPAGRVTPADYEALVGPPYGLTYTLAQAPGRLRRVLAGSMSRDVWRRLNGAPAGPRGRRLGAAAIGKLLFPAAVAAINRAGLGPFGTDLSVEALRRAGLRAMGTTIEALGVEADHVIFGHTHRSGPHPGDDGWQLERGTRLYNGGSWIYERAFLGDDPPKSPYYPGNAIEVDDSGPPRLRRVIA